jgi:predicted Zn-dependent protease
MNSETPVPASVPASAPDEILSAAVDDQAPAELAAPVEIDPRTPEEIEAQAKADAANKIETSIAFGMMNDSDNPVYMLMMGDHLATQNREPEAADWYRNALTVQPDRIDAHIKLGLLLHWYPAFQDEAITLLQRAIDLSNANTAANAKPALEAYGPLADCLDYAGRNNEAIIVLRAWSTVAPLDPKPQQLLAERTEGAASLPSVQ